LLSPEWHFAFSDGIAICVTVCFDGEVTDLRGN